MIENLMWRRNLLTLLCVLGILCHTQAQGVSFVASPTTAKMGVKDQIQVTFTISNVENLADLRPNGFGDFVHVAGPFQSQSMSYINGTRTSSISLTYVLQPKHEGKLIVPPAVAKDASGHVFQSNPITVEVVPGSVAPPQQARRQFADPFGDDEDDPFVAMQQQMQRIRQLQQQMMGQRGQAAPPQPQQPQQPSQAATVNDNEIKNDLFIKVEVDKNKVHIGEQITTSYKLYSRVPMQVSISKLPSLNGFWTQDFDIPKQPKPTEEVVNGKKYQVFLLKKSALFPQEAGTLELDPAEAKGMARILQQVRRNLADPFGAGTLMMDDPFFNNAFFNATSFKDVNVHLKSTPIKIQVSPLPPKNKPNDYGGAVGNFTIASSIDKTQLTTDDVATLSLKIQGSGNLKLIQAPNLSLPNGIKTYDPVVVDTIIGRSTTISGLKTVSYAITPNTPGDYEIPAVNFTYFNPQSGTYTTLHTQPVKLHVTAGKQYNPAKTPEATLTIKEIHDILPAPQSDLSIESKPILYRPAYWSLYGFTCLAFLGLLWYKKRKEEEASDTPLLRSKRATKVALQRLLTAKKYLQTKEAKSFYDEVSKATWLYISDKYHLPISGLSKEVVIDLFQEKKVPADLIKDFESVIWDCETALYASGGTDKMAQTYEKAVSVISNLENIK